MSMQTDRWDLFWIIPPKYGQADRLYKTCYGQSFGRLVSGHVYTLMSASNAEGPRMLKDQEEWPWVWTSFQRTATTMLCLSLCIVEAVLMHACRDLQMLTEEQSTCDTCDRNRGVWHQR
jgi:hypothetical protein